MNTNPNSFIYRGRKIIIRYNGYKCFPPDPYANLFAWMACYFKAFLSTGERADVEISKEEGSTWRPLNFVCANDCDIKRPIKKRIYDEAISWATDQGKTLPAFQSFLAEDFPGDLSPFALKIKSFVPQVRGKNAKRVLIYATIDKEPVIIDEEGNQIDVPPLLREHLSVVASVFTKLLIYGEYSKSPSPHKSPPFCISGVLYLGSDANQCERNLLPESKKAQRYEAEQLMEYFTAAREEKNGRISPPSIEFVELKPSMETRKPKAAAKSREKSPPRARRGRPPH